jgi:DNA gyrase subunit A
MGRNTQGVRLINLTKDEKLIGLERIAESDEDDELEAVDPEGEGEE